MHSIRYLFLLSWLNYVVRDPPLPYTHAYIYNFPFSLISEASTILKRLSERLYQHNQGEQQPDIDSLQEILDSPLFNTIYNLQESFQQLKIEFEKGNNLVQNCLFDFDIEGHLKLINDQITRQSILFFN